MNMEGKCKNKDICLMSFRTLSGANCTLDFGYNNRFEFKTLSNGMVLLCKKNISIEIPLEEFNKRFIEI